MLAGIDVAFEQKEFISNACKPTSGMRFRPVFRKSGQKRTDWKK